MLGGTTGAFDIPGENAHSADDGNDFAIQFPKVADAMREDGNAFDEKAKG